MHVIPYSPPNTFSYEAEKEKMRLPNPSGCVAYKVVQDGNYKQHECQKNEYNSNKPDSHITFYKFQSERLPNVISRHSAILNLNTTRLTRMKPLFYHMY